MSDHSPGRSLGGRGSFQPGPRIGERNQGTQRGAGSAGTSVTDGRGRVAAKGADERDRDGRQDEQDQRDREVETPRVAAMRERILDDVAEGRRVDRVAAVLGARLVA